MCLRSACTPSQTSRTGPSPSSRTTPGRPSARKQGRQAIPNPARIAEVFDADVLLIGLPLYNCGMPSTLKSWFDYVARAGATFQYTAEGPEGLVKGKRAIIAHGRAGKYDDASGFPFGLAHTRTLLGFIGVTDVEVVTAEGLAFGPDAATSAVGEAAARIAGLA